MPDAFIRGLGVVKYACAVANAEQELIDSSKSQVIQQVAQEIIDGGLREYFPVDVFQTGSGTSTNTNINEVIANRASLLAGQ